MANTLRPIFSIAAIPEGTSAPEPIEVSDRVLSFEFVDKEKGADKLSLTFENLDLSLYDDPTFRKGTILQFAWGYPGHLAPPRRAIIQSVKGDGQTITIEAHGLAILMHKSTRTRTWDQTLTSIVTSIASGYASQLGIPGGALAKNIVIPPALDVPPLSWSQAAETDATFLTRLARRYGLEFYVDAQGVHFKPRNLAQTPATTEFTWYAGDGRFLGFTVENSLSGRPGAATKKGLDPLSKKVISHTASNGSGKRSGLAPTIEIVDPITGAESLQSRAAEESTEPTTETRGGAATVQIHAEAKFRLTQHETVRLSFTIVGDPEVAAKKIYRFSGLGKRLSGLYYTSEVTHRITPGGYIIEGKARTDGHGGYGQNNIGSKAALNKLTPKSGATQIEVVDPRTGAEHTEFRRSSEEH